MKSNKKYTIDEQLFLSLAYEIQNNGSTAINNTKNQLNKILEDKVHTYKNENNTNIYYIESHKEPKEFTFIQGVKPKMFNKEQEEQIKKMFYVNKMSKNKIAKVMKCNEKTIRNYLKDTDINSIQNIDNDINK